MFPCELAQIWPYSQLSKKELKTKIFSPILKGFDEGKNCVYAFKNDSCQLKISNELFLFLS